MPVGSLAVRSPPAIAGHPDGSRWGCEDADDSLSRSTAEIDGIYGATRSSVIAMGESTVAPPAVVRTTKNSRADLLFRHWFGVHRTSAFRVCACSTPDLPSNRNTQTPSKSAKAGARGAAIIVSVMLLVLCVICVTAKTPAGSLICFFCAEFSFELSSSCTLLFSQPAFARALC